MRKAISQTHTGKEFPGPLRGGYLQSGVRAYQGRNQDVFQGGAVGQQMVGLKDKGNALIPECG